MKLSAFHTRTEADAAASELLAAWLVTPGVRTVMLAAGNTPLELYRLIGTKQLPLSHLHVYALDEYVGVPVEEPRNCANVIRRTAVEPWGIPLAQYHTVSSDESEALASVRAHERLVSESGGVDVLVLGLGQNGHLGFNEPGSTEESEARVLDLDPISIEANRLWFGGDHAPARGATVGMKTILEARRVIVLAYGARKRAAVAAMWQHPRSTVCPASLLQGHPETHLFLDAEAAGQPESVGGTQENQALHE